MTLEKLLLGSYDAVFASPERLFTTLVIVWTLFALYFRVVRVGLKHSIPEAILQRFTAKAGEAETVQSLLKCPAHSSPLGISQQPGDNAEWLVGDIVKAYWILRLKGYVVIATAVLVFFTGFALVVMQLAQPKQGISLSLVAGALGNGALVPLVIYAAISIAKAVCSIHKLPVTQIQEAKDYQMILFLW